MSMTENIIMQIDNNHAAQEQVFSEAARILAKQREECDSEETARLVSGRALGQRIGEAIEAIAQPEATSRNIHLQEALNIADADHPISGRIVGSMGEDGAESMIHQILTDALTRIDWEEIGSRYVRRVADEEVDAY